MQAFLSILYLVDWLHLAIGVHMIDATINDLPITEYRSKQVDITTSKNQVLQMYIIINNA